MKEPKSHTAVDPTSSTRFAPASSFRYRTAVAAILAVTLSACGSAPVKTEKPVERAERPSRVSKAPAAPSPTPSPSAPRTSRGGGYYLDDGPGDAPPADLDSIPEPVPQLEPLHRGAMRPYVVMGQSYTPMTELVPYKTRGVASWYGRRYHGKQTSMGEIYDMYAMTAAHPVLPLPSYVRVTNVANGRSVVVRVNDRGPFIDNRVIDLSYTAAHRLGVLAGGSALVDVETIIPDASSGSVFAVAPRPPSPAVRPSGAIARARPQPADIQSQGDSDPILAIAMAAAARESEAAARTFTETSAGSLPAAPLRAASSEAEGIYLQLGAFGSRDNAESYLARAKSQLDWLAQTLHLFPRDGMYRVHAGPYPSAIEARQAAERVALAVGSRPVIVTR